MKVAIFGSTGGTGKIMVGKALNRGWDVTAAARSPSVLPWRHEHLRVVQADVMVVDLGRNDLELHQGTLRGGRREGEGVRQGGRGDCRGGLPAGRARDARGHRVQQSWRGARRRLAQGALEESSW
jgi:hypothetical protein